MTTIGTLTFQRASNHGGALQMMALQRALIKLGATAEVIDYRSPVIEARYSKKDFKYFLNPKTLAKIVLRNAYSFDNRPAFDHFRGKYVIFSDPVASSLSTWEGIQRYDTVVVGSDQVWNPNVAGGDLTYTLDWVSGDVRRASYAASFGLEHLPRAYSDQIRPILRRFSHLSVREVHALKILKDWDVPPVEVVLDPTMLHTGDEWRQMFSDVYTETPKVPYVFLYLMSENREVIDHARRLAKDLGGIVVMPSQRLFTPRGVRVIRNVSPDQWFSLLENSSAVVTNSFHGTAMSITMQKDLHVQFLPNKTGVNSRIQHILNLTGLQHRLIGSEMGPILWERVEERLEEQRRLSWNFLRKIVDSV